MDMPHYNMGWELHIVYSICFGIDGYHSKQGQLSTHSTNGLWPIVRPALYESSLSTTIWKLPSMSPPSILESVCYMQYITHWFSCISG
jgi:hypothetical protein